MGSMVRHTVVAFFLAFFAIILMGLLYVVLPQYLVNRFSAQPPTPLLTRLRGTFPLPGASIAPTLEPTPSPGLVPATIIIPKLGIQTAVERAGLTETDNMDVPKNAANVAWYQYGPKPSELGNAVIAGHYDTPTGKPAIFFKLRNLKAGDEVEIVSEKAIRSMFVVTEVATIPYNQFPSEHVFKTRAGKNLNLITCGGIWDQKRKTYLDRIVVYTTLKEAGREGSL